MGSGRTTVVALLTALAITATAAVAVYTLVPHRTALAASAIAAPSSSPSKPAVEHFALDAIPSGILDPAALPERIVEQAVLVVESPPGIAPSPDVVLAVDAATGEWVRVVVPGRSSTDLLHLGLTLALAPDGRSVLASSWDRGPRFAIVRLATGKTRPISPHLPDEDCQTDDATWAPDGLHVGFVIACSTYIDPETLPTNLESWVVEVDVTTGEQRTLDHWVGGTPSETFSSYSPDGRYFAYGMWMEGGDDDTPGGVRTVELTTGRGHYWPNTHMTYGDPWRDSHTVIVWDELEAPGTAGAYLLLDAATETSTSLDGPDLFDISGYVAGHLVISNTPWVDRTPPCAVTYCLAGTDSQQASAWIETPPSVQLSYLSPARALLG